MVFSTLEPWAEGQPGSAADQLHQSAESRSPQGPDGSTRRAVQATAHFNGQVTRPESNITRRAGPHGDPNNKVNLKAMGLSCREHTGIENLL